MLTQPIKKMLVLASRSGIISRASLQGLSGKSPVSEQMQQYIQKLLSDMKTVVPSQLKFVSESLHDRGEQKILYLTFKTAPMIDPSEGVDAFFFELSNEFVEAFTAKTKLPMKYRGLQTSVIHHPKQGHPGYAEHTLFFAVTLPPQVNSGGMPLFSAAGGVDEKVVGVLGDLKSEVIREEDETPIHPDGRIPSTIFDMFSETELPRTVSEVIGQVLSFQEDPFLRTIDGLVSSGVDLQNFRSTTIRWLADMEYLLSFIPEDKRDRLMDYWNTNYSRFPGFADLRVLEEWIKVRGDRLLLFLLGQVVRYQREKENPDGRTV